MKRTTHSIRALLAAAGIAAAATQSANAVTEERFSLFWDDWEAVGATGSSVVVGQLDGGLPNLDHAAWSGAHIIPIVYPLPVGKAVTGPNDPDFSRQFYFTNHATAALGAIGARNISLGNSPLGGIRGFAPASTMIAAGWGDSVNLESGALEGQSFEGLLFDLFMLTDQAFADATIGHLNTFWQNYVTRHSNAVTGEPDAFAQMLHPSFLNQPQYRVATVVNLPFTGIANDQALSGSDFIAELVNIAASMTPATFISSAGNNGNDRTLENADPDLGSVGSPAMARNVISVGFTATGNQGQIEQESSKGASPLQDKRFTANLIPADINTLTPPPAVPFIFEIVSGVNIVAPAVELELPGAILTAPLDNTSFLKGWTGSSLASSIITGAVAQLHDLHRKKYFLENPNDPLGEFSPKAVLPSVVTRAILFNSANRAQGFRNNSTPAQAENNALVTSSPLDDRLGAGRLHMRRLLNQYFGTPSLGGYQDLDGNGDPNDITDGAEVFTFRRDPSIIDAASPLLDESRTYLISDLNDNPIAFQGTDPTIAALTAWKAVGASGPMGRIAQAPSPTHKKDIDTRYQNNEQVFTQIFSAQLIPPGDVGGVNGGGDFGDGTGLGTPTSSNGLTSGESTVTGGSSSSAGGSNSLNQNPGNPPGQLFLAGWDHGKVGTGLLDLPIGLITEGSTISVTIAWNVTEIVDQKLLDLLSNSVATANINAVSRALTRDLTHQATGAGVPVPKEGTTEAKALLSPGPTLRSSISEQYPELSYFEPTVMAGYNVSATAPPTGFDPAQNDNPNDFFDYTTNTGHLDALADGTPNPITSAFRGVCNITYLGRSFTGVAIGPKHVLTAAHNFDTNNDGLTGEIITQVNIAFHGIDTDNDGVGETVKYGPADLLVPVQSHPSYVGIGFSPLDGGFNNFGFQDDLAIITLDLTTTVDDFNAINIPQYLISTFDQTTLPGAGDPPIDIIVVGYGESGFGDVGADAVQFPNTGAVRRIGWNQLQNNFFIGRTAFARNNQILQSYLYDFDGPELIFGEGILQDGVTVGNKKETIHTLGDSGGPAFRWIDSTDGMGGPADGMIQTPELRIIGINNARLSGSAATSSQFGATGAGVLLNSYSTSSQDNWISDTLFAPPTPPTPGTPTVPFAFNGPGGSIADLIEWDWDNLDLEVYRIKLDGSGFALVGASRSLGYTTELVYIPNNINLIKLGNYFARIVFNQTIWDFGGFDYFGGASTRKSNARNVLFNNAFEADTEYGFAFYVELIPDPDIFGTRSTTTRSLNGTSITVEEPYLKRTFKDLIGDMNADSNIDGSDLSALLGLWGKTGTAGQTRGDLNANGIVDSADLGILLKNYTGSGS